MSNHTEKIGYIKSVFMIFCLMGIALAHLPNQRVEVPIGPGFAFSGAGGRLAQHAALMEVLVKGLYPGGKPIRPAYLAGASSGTISALVLNAILQTEETGYPNGITWEYYKETLFNLTNSDIYDVSIEGVAEIFVWNIPHGYVLDNKNLRATVAPYLKIMNYKTLSDLYIPTAFSLVNQSSGLTTRIWSNDPQYANLDILDIVMASAALPIAFPPQQIQGLGDTYWIDGGTGIDTIPSYALLNHPNVTELYIICYGSALKSGGSHLPPIIDDILILDNALATINDMRVDLFEGAVDDAQNSKLKSYTYIPNLPMDFSTLDFDDEQLEYSLAFSWATRNNPTSLN